MSIMFADDFMGYGTNSALLLNGLWGTMSADIVASPDSNDPAGTKVLHFTGFGNNARRPFAVGAVTTAGVAMRLWLPELPGFTVGCIRFLDNTNALQSNMYITPTGAVGICNGSYGHGGIVLGETTIPVITANAFNHIEFKVYVTGGTGEIRVNGVPVLTVTGAMGYAYQVALGTGNDYNGTAGRIDYIKDLVVWNGNGTHNTDFLGTVSVLGMTTNSDVSLGGWTPSTGTTGFNLLANSPPLDGSQYLTAAYPPPPASSFGLTDLPLNVSSVRAMVAQARVRKVDGGDGNLQTSLISAGVSVNGSDRPVTTAFTYYEDVFEVDPNTAASWTPAAANAAQLKLNRTV